MRRADRAGRRKAAEETGAETLLAGFEPQLATLADGVPVGPGWLFEIKLDGYRALAVLDAGDVRLISRTGLDWADRFSAIAESSARPIIGARSMPRTCCTIAPRTIPPSRS